MIYFDNAATMPPLKETIESFLKANECFANPSSSHAYGREAAAMLEKARQRMLEDLHLEASHRLLFTSGATESNNLALKGIALHYRSRGKKIITSSVEHPSVSSPLEELRSLGFEIVTLPVTKEGKVDPETLGKALDGNTILVSIMAVNNEVGAINDIATLSSLVHRYPKCFFHIDATQALGKVDLPYGVADLVSFSGHKFGAFKGCGGLFYKKNIVFTPINAGGEQEYSFRSGTVNMPAFVSMATAFHLAESQLQDNAAKVGKINAFLRDALLKTGEVTLNSPQDATPYVLNFSFKRKKASVVLEALSEKGIYVSSVSACSSKGEPVSNVLLAMGKSKEDAANSMRLSFSHDSTMEEASQFMGVLQGILQEVCNR
jgi:cysteine desulfurase